MVDIFYGQHDAEPLCFMMNAKMTNISALGVPRAHWQTYLEFIQKFAMVLAMAFLKRLQRVERFFVGLASMKMEHEKASVPIDGKYIRGHPKSARPIKRYMKVHCRYATKQQFMKNSMKLQRAPYRI